MKARFGARYECRVAIYTAVRPYATLQIQPFTPLKYQQRLMQARVTKDLIFGNVPLSDIRAWIGRPPGSRGHGRAMHTGACARWVRNTTTPRIGVRNQQNRPDEIQGERGLISFVGMFECELVVKSLQDGGVNTHLELKKHTRHSVWPGTRPQARNPHAKCPASGAKFPACWV